MRQIAKRIVSVSKLIDELHKDISGYSGPIWFRGQADKGWRLLPRLSRKKSYKDEVVLIRQFRQNATLLVNPVPEKTYEWLFLMQHHSAPTRLLDWTESALIAAYFAVTQEPDKDGSIWILLPLELNRHSGIDDIPPFEEQNILENYLPQFINNPTTTRYLPLAISATRNSARMQSQLSVFTINHKRNTPLEDVGDKKHVWRYNIPSAEKASIKTELELLGISKFQLFPELQTLGEIIGGL